MSKPTNRVGAVDPRLDPEQAAREAIDAGEMTTGQYLIWRELRAANSQRAALLRTNNRIVTLMLSQHPEPCIRRIARRGFRNLFGIKLTEGQAPSEPGK